MSKNKSFDDNQLNKPINGNFTSTFLATSTTTSDLGNLLITENQINTNDNTNVVFTSGIVISGERLEMDNTFIVPSTTLNNTFISLVTANTIVSGSLSPPNNNLDFFEKTIIMTNVASGSRLEIRFLNGSLTSADGYNGDQKCVMEKAGQSETFIWDNLNSRWYIKNSGSYVVEDSFVWVP